MSSKLDLLFTHIEVLRSREPITMDTTPIATVIDGPGPEVAVGTGATILGDSNTLLNSDTPVKILQVLCERKYGRGPSYTETSGCNVLYSCDCKFGGWESNGKSDSKRKAKQIAAKELLLQIVENGSFKDFGIPGSDKNDARNYVLGLMPTFENDDINIVGAKTSAENWPGKCIELCQSSKLSRQPEYLSEEEGLPNDKTFTVTASLKCAEISSDLTAVGVAKTKKLAKNQAAKNLYEKIALIFPPKACRPAEYPPDMVQSGAKEGDLSKAATSNSIKESENHSAAAVVVENDSEHIIPINKTEVSDEKMWKEIQSMLKEIVANEEDSTGCELLLKKLLASKHPAVEKVFDCTEMNFVVAEQNDQIIGNIQVYLEMVKRAKNQPQNTFVGEAATEEIARDRACWQALQFIYIFGGFCSGEN